MNLMTSLPMLASVLREIEQSTDQHVRWIIGPEAGRFLHQLVLVFEPESILEIGTCTAYSALHMASALKKTGKGRVYSVESHKERFLEAKKNVKKACEADRIKLFLGHAPEIFESGEVFEQGMPQTFDFLFLDATKKEHENLFDALFPLLNRNGILVIDNVFSHRFGPLEDFIKSLYLHEELELTEIPVGEGFLIARKLET